MTAATNKGDRLAIKHGAMFLAKVPERPTIMKGAKLRCDGTITIQGLPRPCDHVVAEVSDPSRTGGRYVVACRRCGKRHTV